MDHNCKELQEILVPESTNMGKNNKPPAILLPTPAVAAGPRQVKMRVHFKESPVCSQYDEATPQVWIDVPDVICINIYPRGK